jgi:TatD DNase family protein
VNRPVHWIDSHCHLQREFHPEETNVLGVAGQASEAGVGGLVCAGTGADSSREALSVAGLLRSAPGPGNTAFEAWATVGLHPHDARLGLAEVEAVLEEGLAERRDVVVGVGECGLDYHYENSPRDVQREVFAEQASLARRHDLALVVHSRDAWDDTLEMLSGDDIPDRIVLHCFTGGPDVARHCLDLGAYLSFSGVVTFKNASDVREALQLCPLERLMVETDAPFLAPVPHRGQRNKPAWVRIVGEAVAEIKAMPVEEIVAATVTSTHAVFGVD